MRFFVFFLCVVASATIAAFIPGHVILAQSGNSPTSDTFTVKGRVISSDDQQPIPGVNIMIKNTYRGTVSDIDGNFSLNTDSEDVLVFSAVGYGKMEVAVQRSSNLEITMDPVDMRLQEVVIIGYGERQRKDITGAISDVRSEDIEKAVSLSVEQSIQGHMPGVLVSGMSGNPNDRPSILIRGMNTWGVTDPLYVIDGVPVTEFGRGAEQIDNYGRVNTSRKNKMGGYVNILNLVNPMDIESVSVLKDASAAAIYGIRASNGVILITTKKGNSSKPSFNLNMSYGYTAKPKLPELLNVEDYVDLITEAYDNVGRSEDLPNEYQPGNAEYLGNLPTVNWLDAAYRDKAQRSDVNFSVAGSSGSTDYYVSLGYNSRQGAVLHDYVRRYTLSTNINASITKWLRTGLAYRLGFAEGLDTNNDAWLKNGASPVTSKAFMAPWQPIYGSGPPEWQGYEAAYDTSYSYDPSSETWQLAKSPRYGDATLNNDFALVHPDIKENIYNSFRNLGTAYLEVEPINGLYLKGSLSADWTNSEETSWRGINTTVFNFSPQDDPRILGDGSSQGAVRISRNNNYNLVAEIAMGYRRTLGDHTIDLLFDFMDQQYGFKSTTGSSDQTISGNRPYRYQFGGDDYVTSGNVRTSTALQGYLGRISYNYSSKYYLDFSVRHDGTSRFGPDKRWGTFPSIAAAWRISRESFMDGISWITDLKIRGGWGQIGNQEVPNDSYVSTISNNVAYRYGSGDGDALGIFKYGVFLPKFANSDLGWETTETINVAVDGLLFDRLDFTIEYFNKVTDGLLEPVDIPMYVGTTIDPFFNLGSVRNRGLELELGYKGRSGFFHYYIGGNFSTIHNEVLETYNSSIYYRQGRDFNVGGGDAVISERFPLYYIQGYKAGGIFQNLEEVDEYQATVQDMYAIEQNPGDLWFKDINSPPVEDNGLPSNQPDSLVDTYDQVMIAQPLPGYYYGVKIQMGWKGLDFYAFFNGVGDYRKFNSWRWRGITMSSLENQLAEVENRWTETNPTTSMHRAARGDPAKNQRISDWYIEDAGYFRLTNWQIGYDFKFLLQNSMADIQRLRLYIGGNNAFTITKWKGVDPDSDMASSYGTELRTPTNGRSFFVGIDMTF
jgi:TonB-linked SusC/RagA family outer membrane protein